MPSPSLIFFLAVFTLLAGAGAGAWQLRRVRKAKERGERSDIEYTGLNKS